MHEREVDDDSYVWPPMTVRDVVRATFDANGVGFMQHVARYRDEGTLTVQVTRSVTLTGRQAKRILAAYTAATLKGKIHDSR